MIADFVITISGKYFLQEKQTLWSFPR